MERLKHLIYFDGLSDKKNLDLFLYSERVRGKIFQSGIFHFGGMFAVSSFQNGVSKDPIHVLLSVPLRCDHADCDYHLMVH